MLLCVKKILRQRQRMVALVLHVMWRVDQEVWMTRCLAKQFFLLFLSSLALLFAFSLTLVAHLVSTFSTVGLSGNFWPGVKKGSTQKINGIISSSLGRGWVKSNILFFLFIFLLFSLSAASRSLGKNITAKMQLGNWIQGPFYFYPGRAKNSHCRQSNEGKNI